MAWDLRRNERLDDMLILAVISISIINVIVAITYCTSEKTLQSFMKTDYKEYLDKNHQKFFSPQQHAFPITNLVNCLQK